MPLLALSHVVLTTHVGTLVCERSCNAYSIPRADDMLRVTLRHLHNVAADLHVLAVSR